MIENISNVLNFLDCRKRSLFQLNNDSRLKEIQGIFELKYCHLLSPLKHMLKFKFQVLFNLFNDNLKQLFSRVKVFENEHF